MFLLENGHELRRNLKKTIEFLRKSRRKQVVRALGLPFRQVLDFLKHHRFNPTDVNAAKEWQHDLLPYCIGSSN